MYKWFNRFLFVAYILSYIVVNVYDTDTERWNAYMTLRMFLRSRWHKMGNKVNDLCGYKDFKMKAIVDNLVYSFIEETLLKFW
jgi:hypothetical protein